MPDNIAKLSPLGAKHTQTPSRLLHQIHQIAQRWFWRRAQPIADILVTLSHDLQIQCDHQCRAFRLARTIDQPPDKIAVTHHIKLEPEWRTAMRRHILNRTDRHCRQGERHTKIGRRLCRQYFPISILHAGQPGWCQRHRHGGCFAKHRHFGVAGADINGDTLTEFYRLQIIFICPIGGFRP